MLVEAFVGWLVQEIGQAGVRAGTRALGISSDERALRKALTAATDAVAESAPQAAREPLRSALRERFSAAPSIAALDPVLDPREGLRQAFHAQLAPLRDPGVTGTGTSFLDEIGVAGDQLAQDVAEQFFGSIRRLAAGSDTTTLALLLEMGEVRSQLSSLRRSLQPVPAAVRNSLPRATTDFTDREDALSPILRRDQPGAGGSTPVFTINGMAGVGKTALAVHAAHRVAPAYPDFQLYLDLHAHSVDRPPVTSEAALETLLRALEVSPQKIPDDLDERAALWRSRLTGKRGLVLLDNAASPGQLRPLLPASADCLVIVTSRRRLFELEGTEVLSLDVLPAAKAIQLFTRIVGSGRTAGYAEETGRIVELCGRLPLAIRVVAARLRRHPSWSVADVLDELAEIREGGEGWLERTGIVAAFELSYRGLPPDEQRMFRRLGVHPGQDFGSHAAAALDGSGIRRARHLLEELQDKHLVQEIGRDRYVLHDLLHDYARRLAEDEETPGDRDAALDRVLDYYTSVTETVDQLINLLGHRGQGVWSGDTPPITGHDEAVRWAERERANLHAGLRIALDTGRRDRAARLARAMAYFLRLRGYWSEALDTCTRMAEVCEAIEDRDGAAYMLFLCGDIHRLTRRDAQARESYERALAGYREIGHRHQEARTLHSIGDLDRNARRHTEALGRYSAALAVYRELGNRGAEVRALHSIADTYRLSGRHEEALREYDSLLGSYPDDPVGRARVRYGIGDVHRAIGRYDEAVTELETALDALRGLGDRLGEAESLQCLGEARLGRGEHAAAERCFQDALTVYRELGDRHGEARTLRDQAESYARTGRRDEAAESLRAALGLLETIGSPDVQDVLARIAQLS